MAQLTADVVRTYEVEADNELPVLAAVKIFEGAACSREATGYVQQLVAGEPFAGFAQRGVDNSGGVDGAVKVELNRKGVIALPIASVAFTDEGKDVYASDSATFTLTKGSNTRVGYIIRVDVVGTALVAFGEQTGNTTPLTDSSGGTASDTIAVIGATYDQAEVRDAVASLAAKVNILLGRQNN